MAGLTLLQEQNEAGRLKNNGCSRQEIADQMGLSIHAVKRRLTAFKKRSRLDPQLADRLASSGIVDLAGLHSGWLIEKDENGAGQSLYFYLGPDQERVDFAEVMAEVLADLPTLPEIKSPEFSGVGDLMNFVPIADLHVGGSYGDPEYEAVCQGAIDDLVSRLPAAEKAVLIDLGDLLDANDHKGVTPASGNPCDVVRENSLANAETALRIMDRGIQRLLQTHREVEVHLLRGNHDETAYIAVMMSLSERYRSNPRVTIVKTDEEFRVISWGGCAIFPHHGDKAKWTDLKDVWADQFPDTWAAAKVNRMIATGHFHHDRKRDLLGVTCEQFRTLHEPNRWALQRGLISRGSLVGITLHKKLGEVSRTSTHLQPILLQDRAS